jgi:hypothetical protein
MLAVALGLACRTTNEVELNQLQGIWNATEARFVDIESPKFNNVELIELGYSVSMIIQASGDFILMLEDPENTRTTVIGTMVIDGKDIALTADGTTGSGEVFLEGDQVAFLLTAGFEFDFHGDGEPIPSRLSLIMDRVSELVPQ